MVASWVEEGPSGPSTQRIHSWAGSPDNHFRRRCTFVDLLADGGFAFYSNVITTQQLLPSDQRLEAQYPRRTSTQHSCSIHRGNHDANDIEFK